MLVVQRALRCQTEKTHFMRIQRRKARRRGRSNARFDPNDGTIKKVTAKMQTSRSVAVHAQPHTLKKPPALIEIDLKRLCLNIRNRQHQVSYNKKAKKAENTTEM
jgi:hypothetical protein